MRLACLLFLLAVTILVASAARSEEPESITLTPAQVKELQAQIREWVGQAYKAGQADARARCASLI